MKRIKMVLKLEVRLTMSPTGDKLIPNYVKQMRRFVSIVKLGERTQTRVLF